VEPTDDYAALLYDYLVRGEFALAAVAARSIARKRADETLLSWSSASFPQVLIGYAYALGGDATRLSAWCRRTDPKWSLGSDGYVLDLAAHIRSSKYSSDSAICYRLTELLALPPPSTYFGLQLTLRLINIVAFAPNRESDRLLPALAELQYRYTKLLAETDPASLTLSFQRPSRSGLVGRVLDGARHCRRWLVWGLVTWISLVRTRIDVKKNLVGPAPSQPHGSTSATKTITEGTSMSQDSPDAKEAPPSPAAAGPERLGFIATAVAAFAVALWAAFSVVLFLYIGRDELQWTRLTWLFGSVQALAFAGAGALFGTAVQKSRADKAEQRASTAQADADAQRDDAVRGRALASVLQAEETDANGAESKLKPMGPAESAPVTANLRREHARLSRALFGDLVD
jgi:hypothetical protein